MKKILYTSLIVIVFGCEDTIHPELDTPAEIMVVDAWIDQKMERQEIRITRSQPYFESSVPAKISGLTVRVEDLDTGTIYAFREGPVSYYWDPVDGPFGVVGHHYKLSVSREGETFEAFSRLGRAPSVDDIRFTYHSEDFMLKEPYYRAEFVATDPAGQGDAYWIKAWRNGLYLGRPSELNIAYDAGFSAGQAVDGQQFITPIRKDYVNPIEENPHKEGEYLPPYLVGDSLYVEIHSLDPLAIDFLSGMYFQIDRPGGFAELFAVPLANTVTNLKSTDRNSNTQVAGFFNVASVGFAGKKLTQEMADEAKQNQD